LCLYPGAKIKGKLLPPPNNYWYWAANVGATLGGKIPRQDFHFKEKLWFDLGACELRRSGHHVEKKESLTNGSLHAIHRIDLPFYARAGVPYFDDNH
ncbi:hypothetical protein HAX54_019242, partial [Datura stramonium]|nr:hypothetical protein [Datura stramonium]